MFGVNAYGVVVRGGGLYEMDFWFIGVQIEGQFIFANNEGNTTVNLHAFDGTTFCEVRGTAVFAPNGPGLKIPPGVFAYPNGQSCPIVARRPKQTSTASAASPPVLVCPGTKQTIRFRSSGERLSFSCISSLKSSKELWLESCQMHCRAAFRDQWPPTKNEIAAKNSASRWKPRLNLCDVAMLPPNKVRGTISADKPPTATRSITLAWWCFTATFP